eukprot:CAMPEP_0117652760 /NCGR_PEP_ID=MMETSP0804-20121206/2809_1 /TAXON_ID=1074897 /ORGANISM="Tetraselmis astigmatica, Strain CCMP880" /LENGTH=105 /DNA_ID=CAMNT_0005458849 /DNA_START=47 /DNA_END=361 /DNA_ORIENTATION=-
MVVGDKMLQAKRKGSRYGFFSTKFGVAEQWVVEPEPIEGWESAQVVLRNRRLEGMEIKCEMLRVPAELVWDHGFTPSSVTSVPPSPTASIAQSDHSSISRATTAS